MLNLREWQSGHFYLGDKILTSYFFLFFCILLYIDVTILNLYLTFLLPMSKPSDVCTCLCVSGPRLASRLKMFLSDIWSRTATGGIRAMVDGRRLTSAFMSLRSSSNCFRTKERQQEVFQCFPLFQFAIFDHMTFQTPHSTLTFVQDSICWFVPRHRFFAEVLVGFSQALHLTEACVEGHWWVGGVLSHVEVSSTTQLLLNHQGLLQQLVGEGHQHKTALPFSQ